MSRTHGIVEGEKASELLGAVSNDGLFFFDASCHYARVLGDSDTKRAGKGLRLTSE